VGFCVTGVTQESGTSWITQSGFVPQQLILNTSRINAESLPIGTETLGVRFEKWKIPLDAAVEMYEALAIIPAEGVTILLKKRFALTLAHAIFTHFDDDC